MVRICADFNLPFQFVEEDVYNLTHKKTPVTLIVKHIQNVEKAKHVANLGIEKSEGAKVDSNTDIHGILNYTHIKIIFPEQNSVDPFQIDALMDTSFNEKIVFKLKIFSIEILNRLRDVIRINTHIHWIPFVTLRDIFDYKLIDINTNRFHFSFIPGHGYNVPGLIIKEQRNLKNKIDVILSREEKIPIWKKVFLDSLNYFATNNFNECVISNNIALESFLADYIFQIYKNENNTIPDLEIRKKVIKNFDDGLHKVVKTILRRLESKSLEDDEELWNKFEYVRRLRTHAIHSFTRRIKEEEALQVIGSIQEIINWYLPNEKILDSNQINSLIAFNHENKES